MFLETLKRYQVYVSHNRDKFLEHFFPEMNFPEISLFDFTMGYTTCNVRVLWLCPEKFADEKILYVDTVKLINWVEDNIDEDL